MQWNKKKASSKMICFITVIALMTLNVNGLNTPIKGIDCHVE